MHSILIIEDDRDLCEGLCLALKSAQTEICTAASLAAARDIILRGKLDLAIVDINLPDGKGTDLLPEIDAPVILLTANDTEMDIVRGLELGAADYITKPFSLAVLRARVNARLREHASRAIQIDDFRFDFEQMEFFKFGVLVELSKTEQKLLRLLVENRGSTLSRDTLLDRVWSDGGEFVDENALSVAIKRLRDKLGAAEYIKTVYGIGYSWTVKP